MPGSAGGREVPAEARRPRSVSCSAVSWNVTYRQRFPCSIPWVSQRSPKIVLPTPEGPVTRVASPLLSRRRPSAHRGRGSRWGPVGHRGTSMRDQCLDAGEHLDAARGRSGRCACPTGGFRRASSTTRSHRRSTGSRASYSSWMMPSARENSTPLRSSSGVYSPTSSSTVPVCGDAAGQVSTARRAARVRRRSRAASWRCRPPRSQAPPSSSLADDLRDQGLQPVLTCRPQEVTQVDVLDSSAQGLGSKKANCSRCLTSLVCGSDTVV